MFGFFKGQTRPSIVAANQAVKKKYTRRQAGVLTATSFTYIGYYIIRLVFTTEQVPIMKAYGFDLTQIGLILSTFGIGYGVAKIFMGGLVDRLNSKIFLAVGLYLSAFFNLLIGFTQNFYVILFLMLLIAMTQAMGAPACQRQISLWFSKKHRGSIFAIWASAHNAGAFLCVASVQLATLMFSGSLTAVFAVSSFFSVLIASLMLLINTDKPEDVGLPDITTYSGYVEVDGRGQKTDQATTDAGFYQVLVHDILLNKVVWLVTLTSMSIYIVRYGVMSWIPSYLPTKGFSVSWAKWFIGVFELSAVPGVIGMGALSDLMNGRRALICLYSTIAMLACLGIYFNSNSQVILTLALFFLGTLIYAPISLVGLMVNEAVPNYAVGLSTGFMGFFQYIFGETVATALIGHLVNQYGWDAGSYVIYAATLLSIVLLTVLVFAEKKVLDLEAGFNQ